MVVALAIAACGGGGGSSTSPAVNVTPPSQEFTDPVLYSSAATASLRTAGEITTTVPGRVTVGGASLAYTATTGHMTALSVPAGTPEASFFYVAYTLDGAAPATRPVTFFYNGGPGSATVWLHLGSFGPKRLAAGAPSTTVATPFPLVDNAESLLDVSDLVFVDAVGTGLSEAIAPFTNQSFWGVDADAAVFRDFVMRYVAVNSRAASPKFLFGESYGTTRSAVLANRLEAAGVALAGVVLQSSVLDYGANCGLVDVARVSCAGYVPTYGATAAWFHLSAPDPAPDALPGFIAQARVLAGTRYDPAARAFLANGTLPDATLLSQLAATTGISSGKWQARFNMTPDYFHMNLIPGTVLGRYDARVTAPAGSALAAGGDPSSTFVAPSFAFGIRDYLGGTLRYTNPSQYTMLSNAIDSWSFSHDGRELPDVVPDLAAALAHNPRLKVLALNGYHDLATPFYQTELDMARLGVLPNVQSRYYSGGHMTYLDDAARVQEKADLAAFYRAAVAP